MDSDNEGAAHGAPHVRAKTGSARLEAVGGAHAQILGSPTLGLRIARSA